MSLRIVAIRLSFNRARFDTDSRWTSYRRTIIVLGTARKAKLCRDLALLVADFDVAAVAANAGGLARSGRD